MSTPVLPVVKRDASVFIFNELAYYFDQSGARVSTTRATEQTLDDFFGRIGETAHGTPSGEIAFTPTGIIRSIAKVWPYGPATLEGVTRNTWYAGQSIFNGAGYMHTKSGTKSLYARVGISKPPTMFLSPRKQIWGPMSFRYINKIDVQPTDAAVLKTISQTAFADVSFDETKIKKDIYTGTLGVRAAPFNAMGARDGFEIEPMIGLVEAPDDNVGIADVTVDSVGYKVRFAPNNLTEAQLDELASWQGGSAVIAGQDVAMLNEDLVIDAGALTVTVHKVGVVKADNGFGVKLDRNGNIEMVNRMTFSGGVADPLVTVTIN